MTAAIFSAVLTCAASCVWQQQQHRALQVMQWRQLEVVQQSTFSGAAGGAAEISSGAADDNNDIFSGFWWSCAVVAAAAQDTKEGTVVAAAGVGAEFLSEAAGAIRNITGELLSDNNDFQRIDKVQLRGGGSSTGRCG